MVEFCVFLSNSGGGACSGAVKPPGWSPGVSAPMLNDLSWIDHSKTAQFSHVRSLLIEELRNRG